ncbi:pyruvate dehydrogenase E1 component beta subunit [Parasphingorhabdus marina DSM 22363]|uniref:Pyruvate dehydrogenase E1 component beta subunit n=1 Tax=Parasphingorhabdus marina DSM 22363 TaxID=1123272 RepID=A0A1N6CVG2_9SPHN|nr:alpha-ketoacid dehydrogenase subunit beta [Parasphingorhabdus marina]SIN62560.1 pyruvate dehydrogenase E1 component beta subunit [Parasphingorhabdus marina DSM 22363]
MSDEKPQEIMFAQACNMAMARAMADDDKVILLGEDIADKEGGGVFKVTAGLSEKYGTDRVRSTPISEQAIVGAAVGSALVGYRPVAEIMLMNFITVAMDQLVNHAAKLRFMSGGQTSVPLTIRTTTGAGTGLGGQHSDMLEAWLAHVPGLKVVAASNPADAYGLLYSSIMDDNPVVFIENTPTYFTKGPAPAPDHVVPLGKASVPREGTDISLITYGRGVGASHAVAEKLAGEGISCEIIDLRTIAPFDEETVLKSVAKTRAAVVVHEAVKNFGTGAEISSRIHEELFSDLKAPVGRVGSGYAPVPFSPTIEKAWMFSEDDIEREVRKILG